MRALLTLCVCLLASQFLAQEFPDSDFDDLVCKEAEAHRNILERGSVFNPLTDNYDLKYYRFEWYIDPAQYYIDGSATVYFETREADFAQIHFDLSTNLAVSSVMYHDEEINFEQSGSYLLTIDLPAPLGAGVLDSLTITYAGAPPASGLGSFVQTTHGPTPVLWTLSDPFGSQDWWPCKNGLGDKIDSVDVIITTPQAYRGASNGKLVDGRQVGTDKVYHWKHRYPITPYLVAIAVTNYVVYEDTVALSNGTDLQMLNFVYPENEANARTGTADLIQVLQFYDSLFVTYPFHAEKYGHAQFGWGGGMEHQTMSFVFNYGWGLLAHELAHQWFGNMVTCESFEDIWLSEGSATYLEGLSQERFRGPSAWYGWKSGRVNNITSQSGGSVKVPDTTNVNRIFNGRLSYNKGSYLLHMLRWKLGEETFFQGMRNFLSAFEYDYARTPHFQEILEDVSGLELTEFFADWYYGEGYPSYMLTWDQTGGQFLIQLDQTQSHNSVDFFEMPVPVRLVGDGIDTMLRLEHLHDQQVFGFPVSFDVLSVEFDPDLWLISRNNVVQEGKLTSISSLNASELSLKLFPNPVDEELNIVLYDNELRVEYEWKIVNTLGQVVQSGQSGQQHTRINTALLNTGTYGLLYSDNLGKSGLMLFVK
jgi:aminopeptidase N